MTTDLDATNRNQLHRFKIKGMDCAGCARSIEQGVAQLDGVGQCELNFTTETLRVMGDINPLNITERVRELGFDVANSAPQSKSEPKPDVESDNEAPKNFWHFMWQRTETRLALCAALLILPGIILTEILGQQLGWVDALSLVALGLAGWPIARSAWRTLWIGRELNINALMTIAAIGAVIIGAYVEAAMVMVLFAIGEALEGYTASRARHAIRSLMEVAPTTATRLDTTDDLSTMDQLEEEVDVHNLQIGDRILIRPGERVPMDGRVLTGYSVVDQAAITGESRPIDKAEGDTLFAGSINGDGVLQVEVTHLAEENTISRMIRMVEEAQERRAPTQRFVDRFATFYTPAVVVIALLVAIVPPLLWGQPFWNPDADTFGWLYRGLALLVVACPCALVISTPVSIVSAISNAARHGVMVKGGAHLENLSRVQAIAFDKTGTLTHGKPAVVTIRAAACAAPNGTQIHAPKWPDCDACEEVLALAGAVERQSEHPLAHAVVTAVQENGLTGRYPLVENVVAMRGRGVTGEVDGHKVLVGSHRYFDSEIAHAEAACEQAEIDAQNGYTAMMVGVDDTYAGTITVADTLRADSRSIVAQLKAVGVKAIIMLTGDQAATAQNVGSELGVTDIRAELLPEEKVNAVEELQSRYGSLAMVGDGINDAPALATADVGIAMGGAGSTTQAMETADITLMDAGLRQLPFALQLSRATMRTIRANVIVSIGIKLLFLVLVVLGLGTMWMAVLADMGTSLLVTLNGMRLLKFAPSTSPREALHGE